MRGRSGASQPRAGAVPVTAPIAVCHSGRSDSFFGRLVMYQQQITVKHVTTNNVTADQAIIADSVTTGGGARNVASPALLAVSSEMLPILSETRLPDLVGPWEIVKQNERQPH